MKPTALIPLVVLLAACDQPRASPAAAPAAGPTAATAPFKAQAQTAPLTAAGPAATISALQDDDGAQTAASVVRVDDLARQGDATVKLYGMAGGDPAMNGLQTYLAFYQSPAEGWRVFQIGDVLDYRVLSEDPGRADLELTESHLDDASGEIGSRTRRVILGWTPDAEGGPPANVTVTPAR